MRFSTFVVSSLFAAFTALAQTANGPNAFKVPSQGFTFTAGQDATLEWTNLQGTTVTLLLRQGNQGALNTRYTIAAGIPNTGSYTYSVPSDTVQGTDYAIQIIDDQDTSVINYTPPIYISSTVLQTTFTAASSTATSSADSTASTGSTGSMTTMTTTGTSSSTSSTATDSSSSSTTGSSTAASTSASATAEQTPAPTNNAAASGQKISMGLMGVLAAGFAIAL